MKTASPKRRTSRQRWESLGNLGATKTDAAGIAYAVDRDWLLTEGEPPHSICLTDAGRIMAQRPAMSRR